MPLALTSLHFAILPAVGVVVGAFGTLVGAGGGFILVPVLLSLFPGSSPATITSISLAVILLNAVSGTAGYFRERRIDLRTGLLLTATALPAAVAGALVTRSLARQQFEVVFGLAMVGGALYLLWLWRSSIHASPDLPRQGGFNRVIRDRRGATYRFSVSEPLAALISPAAGFVSSLLGIGGGVIHVPSMVLVLRVPVPIATATSQFVLVFIALAGVLVHLATGQFDEGWRRAGLLGLGALVGAQFGVYLAGRVNPKTVMVLLAVGLAIAGVRQVVAGIA